MCLLPFFLGENVRNRVLIFVMVLAAQLLLLAGYAYGVYTETAQRIARVFLSEHTVTCALREKMDAASLEEWARGRADILVLVLYYSDEIDVYGLYASPKYAASAPPLVRELLSAEGTAIVGAPLAADTRYVAQNEAGEMLFGGAHTVGAVVPSSLTNALNRSAFLPLSALDISPVTVYIDGSSAHAVAENTRALQALVRADVAPYAGTFESAAGQTGVEAMLFGALLATAALLNVWAAVLSMRGARRESAVLYVLGVSRARILRHKLAEQAALCGVSAVALLLCGAGLLAWNSAVGAGVLAAALLLAAAELVFLGLACAICICRFASVKRICGEVS